MAESAIMLEAKSFPRGRSYASSAPAFFVFALLVVAVGAWLRIAGHNWDQDLHLNVDDKYVARVAAKRISIPPNSAFASLLDPQSSPINPRTGGEFYVYGALPLYLVKAASAFGFAATGDGYFNGMDGILQTGRVLSALADVVTALLVLAIGWRLWGRVAGLLGAALYSFGALPIQMGHFYLSDGFMTTFMTAALLFSILYVQEQRLWEAGLAGLCAGLSMACKFSAAPIVLVPLMAVLIGALTSPASRNQKSEIRNQKSEIRIWSLVTGCIVIAATMLGLFVGDPFAVLDANTYTKVLLEQAAIQSGSTDQWFSRKFVGTWPVFHLLGQLALLGIGPLVGVAGGLGAVLVAVRVWRRHSLGEAILLLGGLVYFASIAFVELKWVRYLLPLVPYLALFAAALIVWLWRRSGEMRLPMTVRVAVPVLLLMSALAGGFAVNTIFRSTHTLIQASEWLYKNARPGSTVGYEATAIEMPLTLPGHAHPEDEYRLVKMDPLTDAPSQVASDTLYEQLSQADYLVLDTTQATRTVPRLPWRYPVQIRYYDLLNSGRLGFKLALKVTSYPKLFGVEVHDDGEWVDISFIDASHPPIYVFKKEHMLTKTEWAALFADAVRQPSIASRQAPQ